METEYNLKESVSSDSIPSVDDGVAFRSESSQDYTAIIEQIQDVSVKLDSVGNSLIICMIGLGVLAGVICCHIFSRWFWV